MKNTATHSDRSFFQRWTVRVGLVYLTFLVISHVYRWHQPDPGPAPEGWYSVAVLEGGEERPAREVQMRYLDTDPTAGPGEPVILLIHGSPFAASRAFPNLAMELSAAGRVLAPDLPGFGFSTQRIADYGFHAHADYLLQFMDHLGIARFHLVAYSMGGGVALHLADTAPARVASLALMSSIGVQELELLGDFHLNHGLHAAQLLAIGILQEGTPHMGVLDRFPLNRNYARNFFDSDQRPLRGMLEKLPMPVLIWHGGDDVLVPPAAAREHHRIVPQSELIMHPGGHLLIFEQPQLVIDDISIFLTKVQNGNARDRRNMDTGRVATANRSFEEIVLPPAKGALLAIYMTLIALATWVSEDLASIGAGLMAAKGSIGFMPAVVAAFIGILTGDTLLFLAGKWLGQPALAKAPLKWFIKEEAVARSAQWFQAKGPAIILASRFLPGARLPTYFGAGMLGCPFGTFTLYFTAACLLWTPLLVGVAALVGNQLLEYFHLFQDYAIWVVIAAIFILMAVTRIVPPLFSFRGRRLLLSAFRRRTRYEFWPTWFFYIPVGLYIVFLCLRYRRLTLYTVVNPGIYAGGLTGESKFAILENLRASGAVARFTLLLRRWPPDEQIDRARAFMADIGTDFPVVLKPDVGCRGQGVSVIQSDEALRVYLEQTRMDTIIQQHIAGPEFGVFYYRLPGEDKGVILSIAAKVRPTLTGDGKSTLEELILKDDRAVCLPHLHFSVHKERLMEVLPEGAVFPLVEVGAHARGTVFLDRNHLLTPALSKAIDAISHHFKGFYFGRYDVRAPSIEDFQQGRNIKILELNGLTSEVAHIYDPGNSLFKAWRDLMQQWEIAFEISARNQARGEEPISIRAFVDLVFRGILPPPPKEDHSDALQPKGTGDTPLA
jgi:pimeloyl-ACP methyl ester carboxylesterase/membrane protein DedA with SNARE-associated domain